MTAENPCTGCAGNGKVTPLTVPGPGTTKLPAAGPSANVSTGRTARPTRVGGRGVEALAGPARPALAPVAAARAGSTRIMAVGARRRRQVHKPLLMMAPRCRGALERRAALVGGASGDYPGSAGK